MTISFADRAGVPIHNLVLRSRTTVLVYANRGYLLFVPRLLDEEVVRCFGLHRRYQLSMPFKTVTSPHPLSLRFQRRDLSSDNFCFSRVAVLPLDCLLASAGCCPTHATWYQIRLSLACDLRCRSFRPPSSHRSPVKCLVSISSCE